MERCGWCDEEFEYDDWLDNGEHECADHAQKFCSAQCESEHIASHDED